MGTAGAVGEAEGAIVGCTLEVPGACANGAAMMIAGISNVNTKCLMLYMLMNSWFCYVGTSDQDFYKSAPGKPSLLTVVLNTFKYLRYTCCKEDRIEDIHTALYTIRSPRNVS
jgi:hypothetical protein